MQILELHLKNFGKFTDEHIYFSEHVQVFYGENEYGKSTIYAFIKAMLFGMERGRGRAAGKDAFSRYEPWENPNYYAGMMRFRCGDRIFRLERTFDRYTKSVSLICENDGEELSVEDGDLEMILGGMTASSFENTAAIGQLTARPGQELAAELKNYAANYYETGGSDVQLQEALEILKNKKRQAEQAQKAEWTERGRKRNRLEERKQYVESEIQHLKEEYAKTERTIRQLENETDQPVNDGKNIRQKVGILFLLAGVAFAILAIGMWMTGKIEQILIWIAFAIISFLFGINMRKHRIETVDKETSEFTKLQWELERIREELKEKELQIRNLLEEMEDTEQETGKEKKQRERQRALELAEQRLKEAAEEMMQEFGQRLNRMASEIICAITEGKYTRLLIAEDLDMAVLCEGRKIPVERLSRGTLEQIYFSLRMAALELLFEEEMPVLLDDAFVFYDEKRLKSALKWLSEQPRQVIIFSCQTRERNLMQKWKDEVR